MPTIAERLAAQGFEYERMGGSCNAFVRRDGDGLEEVITLENQATAPECESDAVSIATYYDCDPNEPTQGASGIVNGYTLADCLAALEHSSDEYTLLELRLHNGFHRAQA